MSEQTFVPVADVADVPPDTVKVVEAGGRSILLCHHDGAIFAVENLCSHAEQPLERGRVRHGWISCPFHGARFDLETGEPLTPPATDPIATFPVRVEGDRIAIALPGAGTTP